METIEAPNFLQPSHAANFKHYGSLLQVLPLTCRNNIGTVLEPLGCARVLPLMNLKPPTAFISCDEGGSRDVQRLRAVIRPQTHRGTAGINRGGSTGFYEYGFYAITPRHIRLLAGIHRTGLGMGTTKPHPGQSILFPPLNPHQRHSCAPDPSCRSGLSGSNSGGGHVSR